METWMALPVTRFRMLAAKYVADVTATMLTGLINLLAMKRFIALIALASLTPPFCCYRRVWREALVIITMALLVCVPTLVLRWQLVVAILFGSAIWPWVFEVAVALPPAEHRHRCHVRFNVPS